MAKTIAMKNRPSTTSSKQAEPSPTAKRQVSDGPCAATADTARLSHARISEKAWTIWQVKGCPVGQDVQIWHAAEAQLKAELSLR